MNNDFSGGVDAPEKRTAYAFTNFFQSKEDMYSAQLYTRDCHYSIRTHVYRPRYVDPSIDICIHYAYKLPSIYVYKHYNFSMNTFFFFVYIYSIFNTI